MFSAKSRPVSQKSPLLHSNSLQLGVLTTLFHIKKFFSQSHVPVMFSAISGPVLFHFQKSISLYWTCRILVACNIFFIIFHIKTLKRSVIVYQVAILCFATFIQYILLHTNNLSRIRPYYCTLLQSHSWQHLALSISYLIKKSMDHCTMLKSCSLATSYLDCGKHFACH